MEEQPRVSVMMPTYNRAGMIAGAIRSALQQDYENIEIIVMDDGSTDETEEVLKAEFSQWMADKPREGRYIRYGRCGHLGIPGARNEALKLCTSRYIAFLDSDDTWHPRKLSLQMDYFRAHPQCEIVFAESENRLAEGAVSGTRLEKLVGEQYELFLPSACARRELFERFGGFDLSLSTGEDYEWLCRIRIGGVDVSHVIPQTLYFRAVHEGNITLTHDANAPEEVRRIWMKAIRNAKSREKVNDGNFRFDSHV